MKKNLATVFEAALLMCLAAVCTGTISGQSPAEKPAAEPPALPSLVIQPKVIEDPSAPAGWRRYQFGVEPAVSVIMPSAPEATAERTTGSVIVNTYTSVKSLAVYGASRLDGLGQNMETATETSRQEFFKGYMEGFAKGFQDVMKKNNLDYEMKLTDPKKVTAVGRQAFQQNFTYGNYEGSAQLVFAGSGAFCIFAIWTAQTPAAEREAFFNSFHLLGKPK